MKMSDTIQTLKEYIAILQERLRKLEELEKTKTPVEKAYKDWMGQYPPTGSSVDAIDLFRWRAFQKGYNAAYEEKVSQEPEENEWKSVALRFGEKLSDVGPGGYYNFTAGEWFEWALNECFAIKPETAQEGGERLHKDVERVVKENMKWFEEHPEENPLDCLKPQHPEQVADGLKESFREAVKQGVVSSVDKPKKNRDGLDDMMDKMIAELKGQTLYDLIYDWWGEVFTSGWDNDTCIANLVDEISLWLPTTQSAAGSQNAYVESAVEGYNDCINTIRRKLR